jgi:pimeloyl-ACP methyl ester carboxylesterase
MNMRIEPAALEEPQLSFETVQSGISVPYVDVGSGEPLLFVHGSLCDYRYWAPQVSALSEGFRSIAPSLSHYWPAAEAWIQNDFGWENHVTELAEFIVALDIEPVHLVGHSRGGGIALELARRHPRLVKTLTVADPAGPLQIGESPITSLPAATNTLRAKIACMIESGDVAAGLELFVDSVSMPGVWNKSSASFRAMAVDNAKTLPLQFQETLPTLSYETMRDIKCRTLLIEGATSPKMFRNNVQKLSEWIDLAERHTISGASHGMNVSHAGEFNRLIRSFVSF